MTIRNLDALFTPKAIALIGASNQPGSIGDVLARNLFGAGFHGPIMPVNPHAQAVHSTLNYPTVADLPVDPDLAVIATPPQAVPGLIAELGARGCRAAVVITAGFGEGEQAEGQALRQAMLDASRPHLLRVVGPNCLGFISPHVGINASFAQLTPPAGDLAFLTQSGAVATAMLDWAAHRGIGFSHLVSLGDMADVDFGDLLDFLALDRRTRAILLYVEAVTHARKFLSAARIAARSKPVIVVKAGRSAAGAKAALSHTGALAGADAVYDAAFRRVGMLRVHRLRELFEAVATLAAGLRVGGDRVAVLTNGGGIGVLAADAVDHYGGALAILSPETLAKLDATLPSTWSHGNPVDILGDAGGQRYADALAALLGERGCDAIVVLNCPTAVADSIDAARAVVAAAKGARVPILTSWLGEGAAAESRKLLAANRLPTYETPDEAVRAFMHLARYRQTQDMLMQTPPSAGDFSPDRDAARAIVAAALAEDRKMLTEPEAKAVLKAYGIPVLETVIAADPADAARKAATIGFPVALKILSPDITHKSDMGGVRLHVASADGVEMAARDMQESIRRRAPLARITGFIVQAMAIRPPAEELIAGIAEDPAFGPVILFGQGGVSVEVVGDRVIGLPPLNAVLARDLIDRTRVAKLLAGYRDRPTADRDAIVATLIKLSQLAADIDEIVELDINPLLADDQGVLALDARVVVRRYDGAPGRRLAIRPYPSELAHDIALADGTRAHIRPIRPEDEPQLIEMHNRSSIDDIRLRFFAPLREMTHVFAARMTQIDYDREMALVALAPDGDMLGVVRLIADPDGRSGEFAVFVRSDLKGRGLGFRLMTEILDYARRHGIKTVHGDVLRENTTMLSMAAELGFGVARSADPMVVCVEIHLEGPA
jgi:acetyltransferase